jgi:hypothetical protein
MLPSQLGWPASPPPGSAGAGGQMTTRAGTGAVCAPGGILAWRGRRTWPGRTVVTTAA